MEVNDKTLTVRCDKGKEHILLSHIIGSGYQVRSYVPSRANLESHYMDFMLKKGSVA